MSLSGCELLTFLLRDLQRVAVAERAPPPSRCEHFVFETTVDDTKLHLEENREHATNVWDWN